MQTRELMELMSDAELCTYISVEAKKRAKNPEERKDLRQEAWLAISCAPPDYAPSAYKSIAYKAIYSGYWQRYKEELVAGLIKEIAQPTGLLWMHYSDHDPYHRGGGSGQTTIYNRRAKKNTKLRFFVKRRRNASEA